MKKTSTPVPTRSKFSLFGQLCNLIPAHLVSQLARELTQIKLALPRFGGQVMGDCVS
jgi:hypothetical protein